MTVFVVDASVALKWVIPEAGAEAALALRAADRLAEAKACPLVTADARLVRKLQAAGASNAAIDLAAAARLLGARP